MNTTLRPHRGLQVILALALLGLAVTAQAAPPPDRENPLPRQAERVELPFREADESPPLSAPIVSAPALLPWSKLAFQSYRDFNDWEIYSSNDDGTSQSQLTNDGADDIHPRFNRGATRMAFASDRTGNHEIFTMNPDGSGLTQITYNTTDDVNPFWSPDGTRMAFQAYRDGQAEIYVMNADGSGQTRLTTNADYDGAPAWSPDGTKIAFSSYRNGSYRIWVMNSDGNGQTQLSTQPYSFDPTWSPDGSQIAYDADSDGDGWQDLWRMNADGGNPQMVYDPYGTTDAWARSWSPDGRYIAFTYISFINYGGNWYWTGALLYGWDTNGLVSLSGPGHDTDWNPDWQTTDAAAPNSSVNGLPAQSPGPFTVSWSGSDLGASGLKNYDVQVKVGAGGVWTDWQIGTTGTSASYPGLSGQTYYFRARARDNSGNVEAWPVSHDTVTTVEAFPPNTAIQSLPTFVRGDQYPPHLLQWGGSDPGNSGIQFYELQVRDVTNNGIWADYLFGGMYTATTSTSTPLFTCGGPTCAYRVRATDNAQNVEDWPAEGDTQTTFYRWGIAGIVHDNAGASVSNAAITITPHTYTGTLTSDVNGNYAAYALDYVGLPYLAQWGKVGYGTLPGTTFIENSADAELDIFLPSADNIIANGEFESGNFSDWLVQGLISPAVTTTVRHTGDYAAVLGSDQPFTPPQYVSDEDASNVLMEQDGSGAMHMVWPATSAGSYAMYYARRDSNGAWSSPQTITVILSNSWPTFDLGIEPSGVVHVVWEDWENSTLNVYYARRDGNGAWSTPQNISQSPGAYGPQAAVDGAGNLHVTWMRSNGSGHDIYYTRRDSNGTWSAVQNIANTVGHSIYPQIAVDGTNAVHVIWEENDYTASAPYQVLYVQCSPGGAWSPPKTISGATFAIQPALAVENNGLVHVLWFDQISTLNMPVYYTRRAANGVWSAPAPIATTTNSAGLVLYLLLKTDANGAVHVVWNKGEYTDTHISYAQRTSAGTWLGPVNLTSGNSAVSPQLAVNANGLAHVTWSEAGHLIYARRNLSGAWSAPRSIVAEATSANNLQHMLADDSIESVHIAWPADGAGGIHYIAPNLVTQTHTTTLQQIVTVPITQSTPTLSFIYQFGNFSGLSNFQVQVSDGLSSTTLFSTTAMAESWTHRSLDLSAWAGQTITFTFGVDEVAGQPPAWAYIDEVSLGSSYPDVWAGFSGNATGLPGATLSFTLLYGNQGGALASNTYLTLTLPAELTFVGASLPPQIIGSDLVWDVGDLSAKSGSFAIVITTTIAPTATLLSSLTSFMNIGTVAPELETANNLAEFATFVGVRLFLPLIRR